MYERISFTPIFRNLVQQWVTGQIDRLAEEAKAEMDRLKQQKDKLEREQRKLLRAHYADAIPLDLLREEQARIGETLKSITSTMEAYQAEYTEVSQNFNHVFELLDDCGRAYRLAYDYPKRCFNQALFEKILVHEDLNIEVDYAESFDVILDPNIFILKSKFEKNACNSNGQPNSTAHTAFRDFISNENTKTSSNFFTTGLSMNLLVPDAGLEPAQSRLRRILSPLRLPFRQSGA